MVRKVLMILLLTKSLIAGSTIAFVGDSHIQANIFAKEFARIDRSKYKLFGANGDQASRWMIRDIRELSKESYERYLLFFGTNEQNSGITAKNYANSLKYIADYLIKTNQNVKIYIISPLPLRGDVKTANVYKKEIIADFKGSENVEVYSFDVCGEVKYGKDNIHPLPDSYRELAKCVHEKINLRERLN